MIRTICLFALIFILSIALAGCPKDEDPRIRIGYLQSDLHQLPAFIALDKGLFLDEGVDVMVAGVFKAGPEEMSAFVAGELDVGYVGAAPATTAVANGAARVKILAQVNKEGSALVVARQGKIEGVKGLAGKTVAIPGHSTVQDFLMRQALRSAGLGLQDVNVIVLKPPEMICALAAGHIDGFIAWEPYVARALTRGTGRILARSRDIWSHHPCCVLVAATEFMEARPKAVDRILRAHIRATRLIRESPEEAVAIGVLYTGMDAETVKAAMSAIEFDYHPSRDGELHYVRFLDRLGYIHVQDPGIFTDGIIDTEPLDRVEKLTGSSSGR